jgi:hypothetical protein
MDKYRTTRQEVKTRRSSDRTLLGLTKRTNLSTIPATAPESFPGDRAHPPEPRRPSVCFPLSEDRGDEAC